MKNLIDHDSLQRIEPTAKSQAEANQKQAADAAATVKANQEEHYLRENQTEETNDSKAADNDLNSEGEQNRNPRKKKKKVKKPPLEKETHYMGGQLFDGKA